jgi:hypothetical protein
MRLQRIPGSYPTLLFVSLFVLYSQALQGQQIPKKSLRSRFRIRVLEDPAISLDSLKQKTLEISEGSKMSAYLVLNKGKYRVLTGDFTSRGNARRRLERTRKTFASAKVSRACNDCIVFFHIYERKKEDKPGPKGNEIPEEKIMLPADKDATGLTDEGRETSFKAWTETDYQVANTASDEDYLTDAEKNVIYFLNLARKQPKLFAETFLLDRIGKPDSENEISLYEELLKREPLPCLKPDKQCWESAKCHAIASGESGYVGHDRTGCTSYFWGECCQYGTSDPLGIVLQLLIDEGVPSLGHRRICLGGYIQLGVSVQPHTTYGSNAVLDFR